MNQPAFDQALAHKYFSADCFNRTWELIEKPDRTPAENELMLLRTFASLWHWTERDDCTERNRSIGYWQISRVSSLLNQGENARRYAELCLAHSHHEPPFFLGYAFEALARAAMVCQDREKMTEHLQKARQLASQVTDDEDRGALERDLDTIVA